MPTECRREDPPRATPPFALVKEQRRIHPNPRRHPGKLCLGSSCWQRESGGFEKGPNENMKQSMHKTDNNTAGFFGVRALTDGGGENVSKRTSGVARKKRPICERHFQCQQTCRATRTKRRNNPLSPPSKCWSLPDSRLTRGHHESTAQTSWAEKREALANRKDNNGALQICAQMISRQTD